MKILLLTRLFPSFSFHLWTRWILFIYKDWLLYKHRLEEFFYVVSRTDLVVEIVKRVKREILRLDNVVLKIEKCKWLLVSRTSRKWRVFLLYLCFSRHIFSMTILFAYERKCFIIILHRSSFRFAILFPFVVLLILVRRFVSFRIEWKLISRHDSLFSELLFFFFHLAFSFDWKFRLHIHRILINVVFNSNLIINFVSLVIEILRLNISTWKFNLFSFALTFNFNSYSVPSSSLLPFVQLFRIFCRSIAIFVFTRCY